MSVLLIKQKIMKNLLRNCFGTWVEMNLFIESQTLSSTFPYFHFSESSSNLFSKWTRWSLESWKDKLFNSKIWQKFFKDVQIYHALLMACKIFQITTRSSKESELHIDESKRHACSPADAVSRERVAAPCTITGSAAIVSEAPVSHHTPVTMWPCNPRLARAVTIAWVTECHWAERKDSWSNGMAGTCCNRENTQGLMSDCRSSVCRFGLAISKSHHISETSPLASWWMLREWKPLMLQIRRNQKKHVCYKTNKKPLCNKFHHWRL
jgi:hypothetical protein